MSETADLSVPQADQGSSRRWLSTAVKVAVTLALYVLVFYKVDVRSFWARLQTANLGWVALGVVTYAAGQWLSAWRWWVLLRPVQLTVPYMRMVAFYFRIRSLS